MLNAEALQANASNLVSIAQSLANVLSSFPGDGGDTPAQKTIEQLDLMHGKVCQMRVLLDKIGGPVIGARAEIEKSRSVAVEATSY